MGARLCMARNTGLGVLLLVLLGVQGGLGYGLRKVPPEYRILPQPPSMGALMARGLGDGQFVFRLAALRLQHAGNLDGRIFPYRDMDYRRLAGWLSRMDSLDPAASITPTMAAFLFVSTQEPEDTRYLVDYLERHALRDPERKWRWLAQAVYIAWYRLGDRERALGLAGILAGLPVPDLPYWARQMAVFILRDVGEKRAAREILERIAATDRNLPENERQWMERFIARHLSE